MEDNRAIESLTIAVLDIQEVLHFWGWRSFWNVDYIPGNAAEDRSRRRWRMEAEPKNILL